VIIGESPAVHELAQGIPLVGKSGQLLNKALVKAGIDRSQCYIMNCVPVRAPGDKFDQHNQTDVDFGRQRFIEEIAGLSNARVFLALGANPTEWLLGAKPPVAQRGESKREGFISAWRGSVIPTVQSVSGLEDYVSTIDFAGLANLPEGSCVIPTFHPSAVLRQFTWHPWLLQDVQLAGKVARDGIPNRVYRTWYRNDPVALKRLANDHPNLIALDTEMDPYIVGIVTEDEVHVFEYDERYRRALETLLTSRHILKVAHRWLHDYAFIRKCLEIEVEAPIFDSVGGAVALNSALQKELSPHISTRFTNWPYHKWLTNIDQLTYCGMDTIVCYDSYWPMIQQLSNRGFVKPAQILAPGQKPVMGIVDYDHKLLMPLMHMQARGFKIDEAERLKVEEELGTNLAEEVKVLTKLVEPVIEKEIKRFKKPHLFRVQRKCPCCGGGSKQKIHCWSCGKDSLNVGESELSASTAKGLGFKSLKSLTESLPTCRTCNGTGKVTKNLPFNSDSPDQLADVVYRGLHIRPRKYKGVETVKAAQLDPLASQYPIIAEIVRVSELRAELDTVSRLRGGVDNILHCEFDPWGTGSGRIAGKEGLVEVGTNPMNLPKEARRFVVPREGYEFIYPDMAQIEARAMAVLSGDKTLRAALYEPIKERNNKPDYHTYLLNAIHDYDPTISLSRDQSKRVSYAGFYGARPEQLATELTAEAFRKGTGANVDAKMAQRILDTLYRVCPEVPRWQRDVCDEVLRTRKLKSPTGREFTWLGYIADRKHPGELDYEIKKQVWSRLPQDMGAYIVGLGLIDLFYTPNVWGTLGWPLIHVHDAVLFEVPKDKVEVNTPLIVNMFTRKIWDMDFPAEIALNKKGTNWYNVS